MRSIILLALSVLLLAAIYLLAVKFIPANNQDQIADEIASRLQNEIKIADSEAARLISALPESPLWTHSSFSFFLMRSNEVVAWSKNEFLPEPSLVKDDFSIRFMRIEKGDFVFKKWPKPDGSFLLLAIPLQLESGIVNDYLLLNSRNQILPSYVDLVVNKSDGACVSASTTSCLFRIKLKSTTAFNPAKGWFLLVVMIIGVIAMVFLLVLFFKRLPKKNEATFLALAIFLLGTRVVMVRLNYPRSILNLSLFDPTFYASSSFNASVGDLLINSVVVGFLCVFLFINYHKFYFVRRAVKSYHLKSLLISVCCIFVCYLSFLFPFLFVESIYHNSSISLEITDSLTFDQYRTSALCSLLFGCVSAYLILHVFFRLFICSNKKSDRQFGIAFVLGSVLFLCFFIFNEKEYWISFFCCFFLLPILYFSNLAHFKLGITFKTFLYFLVMIIAFSVECSLGVYKFNQEKKRGDQFKFGYTYLVDQDILAEFLLHESAKAIGKDKEFLESFDSTTNSTAFVQEKVKRLYLNSYFERYDVSTYSYNLNDQDTIVKKKFARDIGQYMTNENRSLFNGIYFVNKPSSDTLKRYLCVVPIANDPLKVKGYVVLDLVLKKIIPQTVFPELLVDNRFGQYFKAKDFSYALYSKNVINSSFGDFNYDDKFDTAWLNDSDLYNKGIVQDGFRHVAIEYQNKRMAVITAPIYSPGHILINFSFYIALGLVIILLVLVVLWSTSWIRGQRLNYASRIQLYVYLAFFVPLILVSLTTLQLIIISAENQKQEEYLSKAKILEERISPTLAVLKNDTYFQSQLEDKLIDMADVANLDASLYSTDGKLLASSEPLIFEDQLLSTLINRSAWQEIVINHENSYVNSESIGSLTYNSVYYAVKSPSSGDVIGILSIPFFESAYSLERTEINVISAILGVFSITFILFSMLSYVVINRLISPLHFITNSLRKISLTGINKPIFWKAKDEIGLMASEYNRMLLNLEESKYELQKSQKEIAWREIAQQVAHEIKNPLTPMKLTLQQLEASLNKGIISPDKTQRSLQMLLGQVEILNDIANSFSAFAKMPAPQLVPIDLNALLDRSINLFSNEQNCQVTFVKSPNLQVYFDEGILLRAFSNIILNGIQSRKQNESVEIKVSHSLLNQHVVVVAIEDNGRGIANELREKIFMPHFTTKPTGSGLGLAIVKQTIEICGGAIWFETELDKGTTFFVQLPTYNAVSE